MPNQASKKRERPGQTRNRTARSNAVWALAHHPDATLTGPIGRGRRSRFGTQPMGGSGERIDCIGNALAFFAEGVGHRVQDTKATSARMTLESCRERLYAQHTKLRRSACYSLSGR